MSRYAALHLSFFERTSHKKICLRFILDIQVVTKKTVKTLLSFVHSSFLNLFEFITLASGLARIEAPIPKIITFY